MPWVILLALCLLVTSATAVEAIDNDTANMLFGSILLFTVSFTAGFVVAWVRTYFVNRKKK